MSSETEQTLPCGHEYRFRFTHEEILLRKIFSEEDSGAKCYFCELIILEKKLERIQIIATMCTGPTGFPAEYTDAQRLADIAKEFEVK